MKFSVLDSMGGSWRDCIISKSLWGSWRLAEPCTPYLTLPYYWWSRDHPRSSTTLQSSLRPSHSLTDPPHVPSLIFPDRTILSWSLLGLLRPFNTPDILAVLPGTSQIIQVPISPPQRYRDSQDHQRPSKTLVGTPKPSQNILDPPRHFLTLPDPSRTSKYI